MNTVYLKDLATIKLSLPEKSKNLASRTGYSFEFITVSELQEYNYISKTAFDNNFIPDKNIKLVAGDILIKRVNPLFINYFETVEKEIYIASNIYIIRANNEICSSYLAYILNDFIYNNYPKNYASVNISSLVRKTLEEVLIPLPARSEQENLGNLWLISNKKHLLNKKLAELEYQKEMQLLKQYTFGEK